MNVTPLYGNLVFAEDDLADRLLFQEAWQAVGFARLYLLVDGEDLMDFLCHQGKYASQNGSLKPDVPKPDVPKPDLIVLDLKMPRKSGYEVLREIKTHPELQTIPVVVLSTSMSEADISRSYALGACSYLRKPGSYEELVKLVNVLHNYWFRTVLLPNS